MKYKEVVFISFYDSFPITSGSSNVTTTFFLNCPIKKKILYKFSTNKKIIKNKKIINIYIKNESPFEKLKSILILVKKIFHKYYAKEKVLFILEGASSSIYSLITFLFLKKKYRNSLFVYHGHNVDLDIRKNFFTKIITYFSEKYIYQHFDLGTVVSKEDQLKIKKYYNVKSKIFENFIQKLNFKKKQKIEKYIIFSGSLNFKYNLLCFKKLIKLYFPLVLKIDANFKLVVTGNKYMPKEFERKYIINKGDLSFCNYKKIFKNSFCSIYPFTKSPGTKVKIIESLYNKKITLTNNEGLKGINADKKILIFRNPNEFNKKFHYLYNNYLKVQKIYDKNSKNIIQQYNAKKKIRNFFKSLQS